MPPTIVERVRQDLKAATFNALSVRDSMSDQVGRHINVNCHSAAIAAEVLCLLPGETAAVIARDKKFLRLDPVGPRVLAKAKARQRE